MRNITLAFSYISFVFIISLITSKVVIAQSNSSDLSETIGTITDKYAGSKHSNAYTKISYRVDSSNYTITLNYYLHSFDLGESMKIQYNIFNPSDAVPLFYKPYFAPEELPDRTKGIIESIKHDSSSCLVYYKLYKNPTDSFDITIATKKRYLSKGMFDTLQIRKNYEYKIAYDIKRTEANPEYSLEYNYSEILLSEIANSNHPDLNKYLYSGLYNIKAGLPADAMIDFTNCIKMDPSNPFYYFQRGKCFDNIEENDRAIEDYTQYIQLSSDLKRGLLQRSIAYIRMKKYDEAINDLNSLQSISSDNDEIYYLIGVCNYWKRNYQTAIEYYHKAISYSNNAENVIYYYDLGLAEEKQSGKTAKSIADFSLSQQEAIHTNQFRLHGRKPHPDSINKTVHDYYITYTSDNYLSQYSAINSNMSAELIFPYSIHQISNGSVQALVYDQHETFNKSKQTNAFNLGVLSMEVGAYKSWYGRFETGYTLFDGRNIPGNLRAVAGYNIKFRKNDLFILRPELGCSYVNRRTKFPGIGIDNGTSVYINNLSNDYNPKEVNSVNVTLRENTINISPGIGIWLFPYKSKFVLRFNAGYNFTVYQKNCIYLEGTDHNIRENHDKSTIYFTNTNGHSNHFFTYNGLFFGLSAGIRVH